MIDFKNKRVLVLGLKKSGRAAVRLLKRVTPYIYTADSNLEAPVDELFENTVFIEYDKVIDALDDIDIIVKSPGIKYDIDLLNKAREKKVMIISELELAYQFVDKNKVLVAITGTNGKTTTTTLVTQILVDSHVDAQSVGNIGYSFCDAVADDSPADVLVIECSSFQLLDIVDFCPHVALFLNLSPAHLDYHHTFKNYVQAKMNLIKNAKETTCLIYNCDDALLNRRFKKVKCVKYTFSLTDIAATCFIDRGSIAYNGISVMKTNEVRLPGEHNLYNVLASIAAAKAFYIENENIRSTVSQFLSLEHRLQEVRELRSVTYINDSKATNEKAALCAVKAFNKPLVLILGGLDRGQSFLGIVKMPTIKLIIAYGQTRNRIFAESAETKKRCLLCNNLSEAVNLAQTESVPGDIVLFSPACASWDQFGSYEERGAYFIQLVNELKES